MLPHKGKARFFLFSLIPVFLFCIGRWSGAIPPSSFSYSQYSSHRNGFAKKNTNFSLVEQKGIFPGVLTDRRADDFPRFQGRMPGAVALCDFNNDRYDDVVTLFNSPQKFGLLEVFENIQGKSFEKATKAIGLSRVQEEYSFTIVACADLDNDGWLDLVLGGIGQDILIFKNHRGKLRRYGQIRAFDESREINIFDINQDGFLDIFVGNFRSLSFGDHKRAKKLIYSGIDMNSINEKGGVDKIYINAGNGKDYKETEREFLVESGFTWASGVSDFDNDGNLDLFIAHDLGRDSFFKGSKNSGFKDVSRASLGKLKSRGSMSAVVIDLNDDGLQDFFVSNKNQPGSVYGYNSLWLNQRDAPGSFKDVAIDLGVDACGFSWGAEFADLNQDGYLDISIVNGNRGPERKGDETGWFWWEYGQGAANIDFEDYPNLNFNLFPNTRKNHTKKVVAVASSQRKCLFLGSEEGKFLDAAPIVGLSNKFIARGLVVFDYDKNGTEDLLMVDPYRGPILFKNIIKKMGKWIAISLDGEASNATGIGSVVTVKTNQRSIKRMYYPFNGFQSGSSRELFFTFRDKEIVTELEVKWPSGKVSRTRINSLNKRWVEREPTL